MTIGTAFGLILGLTIGSFIFQVISNKRQWGKAVEHSFFMAVAVLVTTLNSYHKSLHVPTAIAIAIGLTIGSFLYHAFTRRWAEAAEHSYFMAVAVLMCVLVA